MPNITCNHCQANIHVRDDETTIGDPYVTGCSECGKGTEDEVQITVHGGDEFTAKDQYPVFRIRYSTDVADDLTEDLPMVEVPADEDQPGYWDVNMKRLTAFQKQLYSAFGDWCGDQADEANERAYYNREG